MSKNNSEGCFALLVMLLVGIPLGVVCNAFVVMLNWNWFAVPLGAPHLTVGSAAGVAMVAGCFTSHLSKSDDDKSTTDAAIALFMTIVLRTALFAGAGWVLHGIVSS